MYLFMYYLKQVTLIFLMYVSQHVDDDGGGEIDFHEFLRFVTVN